MNLDYQIGDILIFNKDDLFLNSGKRVRVTKIHIENGFYRMDLEPIDTFIDYKGDLWKDHNFKRWDVTSAAWKLDIEYIIKFTINQILSEKD